jgi:anti-anti-sigma regulatory factor
MPITITPAIDSPTRITAGGAIDAIGALDIVDLLDLTNPESAEIDVRGVPHVSAAALKLLATAIRRDRAAGREVSFVGAQPLVALLLTMVGLVTLEEVAERVAA